VKIGLASVRSPRNDGQGADRLAETIIFGPSSLTKVQLTAHCSRTPTTGSRMLEMLVGQLISCWSFLGKRSAEIGTASCSI